MQYASSLLYGGSLMDAANGSTYEDYKRLLLVCPHCKNPVFLVNPQECRKAHQRIRNGKTVNVKQSKQIDSYWAHFPGVDSDECERKAKTFSRKDRERIEANARNQRLKLFQRHFWRMFSDKCLYNELFDFNTSNGFFRDFVLGFLEQYSKTVKSDICSNVNDSLINGALQTIQDDSLILFRAAMRNSNAVKTIVSSAEKSPQYQKLLSEHKSFFGIEMNLHRQVFEEVLKFLCSKSGTHLFSLGVAVGFCVELGFAIQKDRLNVQQSKYHQDFKNHMQVICLSCAAIFSVDDNYTPNELIESVKYISEIALQRFFMALYFTRWGDALHELASSEKVA